MGHARKERVGLFGTDQRITSGPAARRPHSKAEYMTAPERFADSQIPLAPRAPSIHDPTRSSAGQFAVMHNTTVLDFFGGWGSRRGRKPGLSCSGFLSTDNGSAQEFRITDGRPLR